MAKKDIIIITETHTFLTVEELSEASGISLDLIQELIDYDVIHPTHEVSQSLVFDLEQLQRVRKALRLQHDLELNLHAVAVMLDLLDQMEALRTHVSLLQKHLLK